MHDLISVVVPIYKVPENLLRRCVESILNQTYKKIELILVDDGSPDNCPIICDEYAKKDSRVVVIHQKNRGLAGARNSGQDVATGYYLTFVDGDDYIDNDSLERLYSYSKNKKYDLIRGMFYKEYGENRTIKFECDDIKINHEYVGDEIIELKDNVLNFNANISSVCGCLYKTQILKDNQIYNDEKLRQGSEDVEFSFRLYDYINTAIVVPEYFYHYVYNDNSISTISTDENNYRVLKCFDKIYNNIENIEVNEFQNKLKDSFNKRILYVVVTSMISGYFNPKYNLKYKERKIKADLFLKSNLVVNAMNFKNINKMDKKRKIILVIIKFRLYILLSILGKMRYAEKHHK